MSQLEDLKRNLQGNKEKYDEVIVIINKEKDYLKQEIQNAHMQLEKNKETYKNKLIFKQIIFN